jgi:hypothetical protein
MSTQLWFSIRITNTFVGFHAMVVTPPLLLLPELLIELDPLPLLLALLAVLPPAPLGAAALSPQAAVESAKQRASATRVRYLIAVERTPFRHQTVTHEPDDRGAIRAETAADGPGPRDGSAPSGAPGRLDPLPGPG